MKLERIVEYLDGKLKIADFPGDSSLNGLQVEGARLVTKISLAVDACDTSIKRAARSGSDLLIVHHGLFWGQPQPVTGFMAKRIGLLLENGISLYAAHLPLDSHPEVGNNIKLAELLGVKDTSAFGTYHGTEIGMRGRLPRPVTPRTLSNRIQKLFGAPVACFPFGPKRFTELGICSGGGAFLVQQAARAGCGALLTGEPSHTAYHPARESRINLICAGHYATETLGVKALGEALKAEFGLPVRFIDVPTGL
jgi:dinuclear metal center YbgI/SA1388 family protein